MKKNKIAFKVRQEQDCVQVAWMDVDAVTPKAKIHIYESGLVVAWNPNGEIVIEQLLKKPHVVFDNICCTMEIEN